LNAALRLINLAVIVLVAITISRKNEFDGMDSAEAAGRWMGALLLGAMPLLSWRALAPGASRALRTAAIRLCWALLVLFAMVGLFNALDTPGLTPAVLGLSTFAALCSLNIWTLRRLRRQRDAGEMEDAERGLIRYWHGELPLGVTFWAGGVTLLLLQLALAGCMGMSADALPLRVGAALLISLFAVGALLLSLQIVSVWRSAARQARERGGPWPPLARAGALAMLLAFGVGAATLWRAPLTEHALIAIGRDPLQPLNASITTGGSVLLLHGTFGTGSARRVETLLSATPTVKTVALMSNGGRLREASQIAELVRARKLDTYVDTRCESACTFVFLAGKDRAATPNARLGFHRPSFAGMQAAAFDSATEGMLEIYREAGLPKPFLDRVAATDSSNMWYPTPQELEKAGVINRVSLGGETSALGYVMGSSSKDLESAFRRVPMMVALEKHFPGTIDEAVKAAWMERNQGGVDAAVSSAARNVVAERYPKILAAANDASLDDFAAIMVDEFRAARAISVEACRQLLAGQLNIAQVLSPSLVRREHDWALAVLRAPKLEVRAPVDDVEFQRHMSEAMTALSPEDLEVISDLENYDHAPDRQCDATIALYERLRQLPAARRHLLLRGMFQEGSL
jgi:hypothetical protein